MLIMNSEEIGDDVVEKIGKIKGYPYLCSSDPPPPRHMQNGSI
jgi:hypothetical protein